MQLVLLSAILDGWGQGERCVKFMVYVQGTRSENSLRIWF